jgi:hypothetical protein
VHCHCRTPAGPPTGPLRRGVRDLRHCCGGVDLVIEATGRLRACDDAAAHLKVGACGCCSRPGKERRRDLVMGVNERSYDPVRHEILSTALPRPRSTRPSRPRRPVTWRASSATPRRQWSPVMSSVTPHRVSSMPASPGSVAKVFGWYDNEWGLHQPSGRPDRARGQP